MVRNEHERTRHSMRSLATGKPNPLKIEFPLYIRGDFFFRFLALALALHLVAVCHTWTYISITFIDSIIAIRWRDGSELTQTQSR